MILNGSVNGWYLEFEKPEQQQLAILAAGLGRPPREIILAIIQIGLDVSDKDSIVQALK